MFYKGIMKRGLYVMNRKIWGVLLSVVLFAMYPLSASAMGDARYNMGNSLMVTCAKLGMHFVACTSKNYFPEKALVDYCCLLYTSSVLLSERMGRIEV